MPAAPPTRASPTRSAPTPSPPRCRASSTSARPTSSTASSTGLAGRLDRPACRCSARARFTDKLFPAAEHRRMVERLKATEPGLPGPGVLRRLQPLRPDQAQGVRRRLRRRPPRVHATPTTRSGDLNADPPSRPRPRAGVTTRLNRFIDHYAEPPANTGEPAPALRRDRRRCRSARGNAASLGVPADEPGPRFTAPSFAALGARTRCRSARPGTQATTNPVPGPTRTPRTPTRWATSRPTAARCPVESPPAAWPGRPGRGHLRLRGARRATSPCSARPAWWSRTPAPARRTQLNARLYDLHPTASR